MRNCGTNISDRVLETLFSKSWSRNRTEESRILTRRRKDTHFNLDIVKQKQEKKVYKSCYRIVLVKL